MNFCSFDSGLIISVKRLQCHSTSVDRGRKVGRLPSTPPRWLASVDGSSLSESLFSVLVSGPLDQTHFINPDLPRSPQSLD